MPGQVQGLNDEQLILMTSRFPQRDEPNYAWGNVCSFYQALPALRAFWPCGAQIATAQTLYLTDIADNFHLVTVNAPLFGYESLIPYVEFNGANTYAYYGDNAQFDILATEVYNAVPGLTWGCWFYPDRATGNVEHLLSKYIDAATGAYRLARGGAGNLVATISNGAGVSSVSASIIRQSVWQMAIGRFRPGTFVDVFLSTAVGTLEPTFTGTATANIQNSATNLTMASDGTPANYFDGKISLAFICASALSDTMINAIYQLSRPLFGQ